MIGLCVTIRVQSKRDVAVNVVTLSMVWLLRYGYPYGWVAETDERTFPCMPIILIITTYLFRCASPHVLEHPAAQ